MISELQSVSAWDWSSMANPKDATFRDLICPGFFFKNGSCKLKNQHTASLLFDNLFVHYFLFVCFWLKPIINKRVGECRECKCHICCFICMHKVCTILLTSDKQEVCFVISILMRPLSFPCPWDGAIPWQGIGWGLPGWRATLWERPWERVGWQAEWQAGQKTTVVGET